MAKNEWINRVESKNLNSGENSQVRMSLGETIDGSVQGVVQIRKWAKYCTAIDKAAGNTKDSVPFRPTNDGLGFPVALVPEIISELQAIYDYAIANKMVQYIPPKNETEKPANPPKKPTIAKKN
jgi:hypothetical protein